MDETILERIQRLESELDEVREGVSKIELMQNQGQVDFVDFGDIKLFMLKNDNLYDRFVPDSKKNQSIRDYLLDAKRLPKPLIGNSVNHLFFHILNHLWDNGFKVTVLDVGCHIGLFGLRLANLIRYSGRPGEVVLFDIGRTAELVPPNIRVNRLGGVAHFERIAISDISGPAILYHKPGYSDSDNIFSDHLKGSLSYLVDSIALHEYITKSRIEGALVIKLDVEGLEPQIIQNIKDILLDRIVILTFEFTPSRFEKQELIGNLFSELFAHFLLFDIFYAIQPTQLVEIEPSTLTNYVDSIYNRTYGYTDILCIPKKLKQLDRLLVRLNNLRQLANLYSLCQLELPEGNH